jgi:leucyl-tRNA synthetase
MHKTIRDVTNGVESFGFNAAIAKLYAFTNTLSRPRRRMRPSARPS